MISADLLDELARFDSAVRRQTRERRHGEQESTHVGEGLTFSDYRRYAPGDDTRRIDWRLYARTEEFFVKQFEAERNLTVHVLVDASASMDFGEGDRRKFEFGAKLGVGVAYLTASANNDFRFSLFRERPERLDVGRSNRSDLLHVIDRLNETQPSEAEDFVSSWEECVADTDTKSLVFVVSDFLAEPDDIEAALGAFNRSDVVAAQVLAPEEISPEESGDTVFTESERDERRRTYFGGTTVDRYESRLNDHIEEVSALCHDVGATHTQLSTGTDFFDAFADVWAAF